MKTPTPIVSLVLVFAVGFLSGCQSFRGGPAPEAPPPPPTAFIEEPAPTADLASEAELVPDLRRFHEQVLATRLQVGKAVAALARISGAPDPVEAYAAACSNFSELDAASAATLDQSGPVRTRCAAHLKRWADGIAEIADPEIRAHARIRHTLIGAKFDMMTTPLLQARADLTALNAGFADLQRALGFELTADGVAAARDHIARLVARGEKATASLTTLASVTGDVAAVFPPPAP